MKGFNVFVFVAAVFLNSPFCFGSLVGNEKSQNTKSLWLSGGHDLRNSRNAWSESKLGARNVSKLEPKWIFTAHGDVTATPAVDEDAVYVPDLGGYLNKIDRRTGQLIWTRAIASYTGSVPGVCVDPLCLIQPVSRSTPALSGRRLVIGTRDGYVLGIDKRTGDLLWKTRVDSNPAAMITMSPIIFGNTVYIGISSAEEALALLPGYHCCTFRGSAIALNLKTGAIEWRTYTVPEGYSGGALWGGPPAVDTKRNVVYFTTGNNYSVPPEVQACVAKAGKDARLVTACLSPTDYFDSILALDRHTGKILWGTRLEEFDAWTLTCGVPAFNFPPSGNCPFPDSPDYDFGSGVNLFTIESQGGEPRDLVGAGQKSGSYWALDANTGKVVWVTQVGPGGADGGIMWGSAVDSKRIYVAVANSEKHSYTLQPTGGTINWGAWSALDAKTGKIVWQTPDPGHSGAVGFVSTANGVVYAASTDPSGYMYALDGSDGSILWSFPSGGSTISGAAIVDGTVYWGSGYASLGGTGNNKVYAFRLPGHAEEHDH